MKDLNKYIITLLLTLPLFSWGQLSIVEIKNFPDTAYLGEKYDFSITVKNTGTDTYKGLIQFDYLTDSMLLAGFTSALLRQDFQTYNLMPGAVMEIPYYNYVFPSQYYREEENNGVLIWPKDQPADTAQENVYIKPKKNEITSVIAEEDNFMKLKLYPNPADDQVYIEQDVNLSLRITILNIRGEIVNSTVTDARKIFLDLAELKPGIYMIHMMNTYGILVRKKLLIR